MATAVEPHDTHDQADGHGDWHHRPFSAHHFDNAEQQFDSGKLGMWLFLVTEVLFFSGLFCAYAVFRFNHPEVFEYASQYLDKYLGGMNTVVLIFSSLTMAWGVRCAQLGQKKGLIVMLGITLFCAALFLGVKTFEYTEKYHKRLLWMGAFVQPVDIGKKLGTTENPQNHMLFVNTPPVTDAEFEKRVMGSLDQIQHYWLISLILPALILGIGFGINKRKVRTAGYAVVISILGIMIGIAISVQIHHAKHALEGSHAAEHGHHDEAAEEKAEKILAAAHPEHTVVAGNIIDPMLGEETSAAEPAGMKSSSDRPHNANLFFSIYYFMTGLHAFHIICGMIAIGWLMVRSVEGHFRPDYFGPVDYVGLYWHIVDLIWIFLFPLLYLIPSAAALS